VPVIMGVLPGNQMEANLRRALTISNGARGALFGSPLALTLWVLAVIGYALPLFIGRRRSGPRTCCRRRRSRAYLSQAFAGPRTR
jgi:TctA family transporter